MTAPIQKYSVREIAPPLAAILMAGRGQTALRLPPQYPALRERYDVIVRQSEEHNLPIGYVGQLPVPARSEIVRTGTHDWIYHRFSDDPAYHDRDGLAIPKQSLQDLKRIRRAGLEFNEVIIAHELPAGTVSVNGEIPQHVLRRLLTPGPSRVAQQRARQRGQLSELLVRLGTLPLLGLGAVVAGGAVAGAVGLSLVAGLDPILFGVVTAHEGPAQPNDLGAWFYLTHWVYE